VAANSCSAILAAPFITLSLEEFFYTRIIDIVKVFYHAHMVFCPVALIQCLQSFTGEIIAFKTKSDASFCQQFARISHMRAVFSPEYTPRTIFFVKPLFVNIFLHELKSNAQTTIHAARSNQFFVHRYTFFPHAHNLTSTSKTFSNLSFIIVLLQSGILILFSHE
jgi:hypothetical protein